MAEQIPFGSDFGEGLGFSQEFAKNPEPRVPCVLLLDVSSSMDGERISQLNAGLVQFKDELDMHGLARKRADIAIVTFGGQVQVVCDFTTADNFRPPTLTAYGNTPMGAAIRQAIEMVDKRKQVYKKYCNQYYRPWIFLITDGEPTDEWRPAADEIGVKTKDGAFLFFAIGVADANLDILKKIAIRTPLELKGLQFRELFIWLLSTLKAVSASQHGTEINLPPLEWAKVIV